jgi:hypothetical protein
MTENKRKRPDRAEAAKRRKSLQHKVVKCSLTRILNDDDVREEIERWVENVSKSVDKASLVLNRILLECLKVSDEKKEHYENLPDLTDLTLYSQCVRVGSGNTNSKPVPGVQEIWDACFKDFKKVDKIPGISQAHTYAATTLKTNVLNSLVEAFNSRQRRVIKTWLRRNGFEKTCLRDVQNGINGLSNMVQPLYSEQKIESFVGHRRNLLGLTDGEILGKPWLKKNYQKIIKYYWIILKYLEKKEESDDDAAEQHEAKRFCLVPICRVKRHFITIDVNCLWNIMRNTDLINTKLKESAQRLKRKFRFG